MTIRPALIAGAASLAHVGALCEARREGDRLRW
jgi:hypothetical protein